MLSQKRAIMVIALAVPVTIGLVFGISYNSVFGQQADQATKFQTMKAALLSIRHAYPDEGSKEAVSALSAEVVLKNAKLGEALEQAEIAWKLNEEFCSQVNCKIMEVRPYELTADVELSQTELAELALAVPAAVSQQEIESLESGSEVMVKHQQTFIEYNGQTYIVSIRSAWT